MFLLLSVLPQRSIDAGRGAVSLPFSHLVSDAGKAGTSIRFPVGLPVILETDAGAAAFHVNSIVCCLAVMVCIT